MKTHGRIDHDGKRRVDVYIDPDGGYILASRVIGKALTRLQTMDEYRMERYECTERGELIGDPPQASAYHREIRAARLERRKPNVERLQQLALPKARKPASE